METHLPEITDSIIRCAIAVHRELGPGLPEHSYQTAVALELDAAGLRYVADRPITVRYRGVVIGWHRPDFIVEDKVVVELKAASNFDPAHSKQVFDLFENHEPESWPAPQLRCVSTWKLWNQAPSGLDELDSVILWFRDSV